MFTSVIAVAGGGAIGAVCRYLLILLVSSGVFPFATLLINTLGSFMIGMVSVLLTSSVPHDSIRLFLQIGILGGFTTFSTYSLDAVQLLYSGKVVIAFVYMSMSVVLCLASVVIGMHLTRLIQQSL